MAGWSLAARGGDMSDWGSGYITDSAYVHDFCRVQTPPMLALAALAGGVESVGGAGEPLSYCDLGCGQGYTANIVAAANPAARVFGYDFNPGHIANARALASEAGLANVQFREASFAELAGEGAPQSFDMIALHGIFSWISTDNRRSLVALIGQWLKPGGLLYISYDCMPGWAGVAPLRRILARSFAPRPGLSSPAALERALSYSDALRAADSRFHRMFPNVEAQLERLKNTPRAYLSHELLTREWEAFCFGQVADALAEAKLVYIGSAHLTDGVDRVNFTAPQLEFLAGIDDPVLAEETRDMLLSRQFRRDIFVKGRPASNPARLRERWLDTRFVLTAPEADFDMCFDTALGKMQLRSEIHGPLIESLRKGPVTLREMLKFSPESAAHWTSLVDAIKILVGRGDVQPALPFAGEAARAESVRAFNGAVLARATESGELTHLASPVTASGVAVDRLAQLYLLARRRGLGDPAKIVTKLLEGAAPEGEGDTAGASAAEQVGRIENKVAPLLARLGIE